MLGTKSKDNFIINAYYLITFIMYPHKAICN